MTLFGGIVEVRDDRVGILARESETVDTLDIDAILAEKQIAEKVLSEALTEQDLTNAQVALERSVVRMGVVNHATVLGEPCSTRCARCGCDICQC